MNHQSKNYHLSDRELVKAGNNCACSVSANLYVFNSLGWGEDNRTFCYLACVFLVLINHSLGFLSAAKTVICSKDISTTQLHTKIEEMLSWHLNLLTC